MKTKTFGIVLGAFMALTASATTCYYYAWPLCPNFFMVYCPNGNGQQVIYCDNLQDHFESFLTSGGPHDSRYCGTTLVASPCRYTCFYYTDNEYINCGSVTNSLSAEAPDTRTGFCPDKCPGSGS